MSAIHFGTALFGHKLIYLMLLLGSSPITKREKETNIPYGIHDDPPPPAGIVRGHLTLAGDTPFCDEVSWPTTNESLLL